MMRRKQGYSVIHFFSPNQRPNDTKLSKATNWVSYRRISWSLIYDVLLYILEFCKRQNWICVGCV